MESWDTSPHLGVTELWQSVVLELFLHAPRSRGVVLLSVYSRNFENYLQWTEGQRGESTGTAVDIDSDRNKSKWTCNMNGGVANIEGGTFSSVIFSLKEGSLYITQRRL